MKKLQSLRDYLLANVPKLGTDPDRLLIFADKGKLVSKGLSLSFEYDYTAHIIITDFADESHLVMIPLLAWYKANQQDKALAAEAINFEAEILNKQSVDLSIQLSLTDRVIVTRDNNGDITNVHYCDEPKLDTETFAWPAHLVINGEPNEP